MTYWCSFWGHLMQLHIFPQIYDFQKTTDSFYNYNSFSTKFLLLSLVKFKISNCKKNKIKRDWNLTLWPKSGKNEKQKAKIRDSEKTLETYLWTTFDHVVFIGSFWVIRCTCHNVAYNSKWAKIEWKLGPGDVSST